MLLVYHGYGLVHALNETFVNLAKRFNEPYLHKEKKININLFFV